MKTILFILIIVLILAGLGLLWNMLGKRRAAASPEAALPEIARKSELTGKMIVDSLDGLGYFRFANPHALDSLKKEIESGYDELGFLASTYDEQGSFRPNCNRLYLCDGETLFEIGGLDEMLQSVKPLFGRLNVPLQWTGEYWNEEATLHTIVLNGKQYEAYSGGPDDQLAWGHATRNFVNMLNDQLEIHGAEERVYPILYGNDGRIIFLSPLQFDFIQRHFHAELPLTVADWWEQGTR